jgi:hypothetical protein
MRRKGIGEDLIQRELRCMEHSIRAELFHGEVHPGGGS